MGRPNAPRYKFKQERGKESALTHKVTKIFWNALDKRYESRTIQVRETARFYICAQLVRYSKKTGERVTPCATSQVPYILIRTLEPLRN